MSTSWADLLREKRSLAAVVRDAGKLCVTDSVDILLDVCDQLANTHANGIVHGDLGLHRVRTMWPRRPGDHVDIFALDADDTGAIDFRAAFQAPSLSPEQRAGRIGDQRSDIWALGSILHALIGGAPPSRRPVREVLAGAPRAIITCVESCLADNPDERPRSVDDVAGALASFASSSPDRFQALARRRIASLKAKHVNDKVGTLGRLDELAVNRESSPPFRAQPMPAAPVTAPFMQPVHTARNETYPPPRMPSRPSYSSYPEAPVVHAPVPSHRSYPEALAAAAAFTPSYPEAPVTAARMPSYAEAIAAPRMPSRPSYPDPPVSVEWPVIHGVPSMSIAVPPAPVAPYPAAPSAFPAAPGYPSASAYPAAGAYPSGPPAPAAHAYPSAASMPAVVAAPSTFPSVAAPSGVPVPHPRATAPLFNPALYPAAQSSVPMTMTPSVTPPPVSYGDFHGYEPSYIPAPPPAHRAGSYHPPSIGPVSLDLGAPDPYFPPPARVPSFGDLAEYREAKRASRKTAIFSVIAAAAVIALGLGFGSQMLEKDRAAVRAAQAAAAAAPAPPPAVTAIPAPAPTPAVSATTPSKVAPSAAPASSAAPKKAATKRSKAAPTSAAPATSKDDRPDTAAADAFSDAIGKKDPAPAGALSDALK